MKDTERNVRKLTEGSTIASSESGSVKEQPFTELGCVIMASGEGKRFGGNKLMAPFGKGVVLEGILRATEGIFGKRVVVTRSEAVAKLCESQGILVILHEQPFRSDTVRLGIEAMGPSVTHCMFCPGDQPLITQKSILDVVMHIRKQPRYIWRTCYETEDEVTVGAPISFPNAYFDALRDLPQGKGGGYLAKKYPEQVRLVPVRDACELYDIDTPEDYESICRLQER